MSEGPNSSSNVFKQSLSGVAALGSLGVLSAVIGIGVSIALARMLTPAEFGVFVTVLIFMQVVSSLRDFGLSSSLVFQPQEPTIREIRTAFTLQLSFCTTIYILLLIGSRQLIPLFSLPPETY